jgi:hypothetical protein
MKNDQIGKLLVTFRSENQVSFSGFWDDFLVFKHIPQFRGSHSLKQI